MDKIANKIAVVYLDRWDNKPNFRKAFLHSLQWFPAGVDFDLVWQMKGYPDDKFCHELIDFKKRFAGKIIQLHYPDDVYQFTLALDAAEKLDYDLLVFFISYSRILAPNWLKLYVNAFENNESCGMVGATGSYEQAMADQKFPNYHIRTNAFMIKSDLFKSLDYGVLRNKIDGNFVEAGPNSITSQILQKGLNLFVIDRFGRVYSPEKWPISRTFRSGCQENLLVADNRTSQYSISACQNRSKLSKLAWGRDVSCNKISWVKRFIHRIIWYNFFANRLFCTFHLQMQRFKHFK
ncbi:hypothetical protein ABUK73_23270 [Agrobacterium sp. BA1120]|uniref:hypothetical protein n=1 Tax=Agrobacterium sp. BA1120 TaxID=3228927 RepID=UPI00336AB99C